MEKKFELNIMPPAHDEIVEIAQIRESLSGRESAVRILKKIADAMDRIQRFPFVGAPVPDQKLSADGYRFVLAEKYLIIYLVIDNTVYVDHVAHGSTDYPKLFQRPVYH